MTVASMTMNEFRVGEVLSRSMAILARNIVPFGLLALVFTTPSFVIGAMVDPQTGMLDPKTMQALEYGDPAAVQKMIWLGAAGVGLVVLGLVLGSLATGTMVFGTFQDLRGSPARFGDCLRKGLAVLLPIIGVALLNVLLMMLGGLLLLFPMFMIMTALWVAIPTAVVERPGVIASLKRSAALTKGYRWRIFGIFAVIWLVSMVAASVVQAPFMASMITAQSPTSGAFLASHGMSLLVNAFFTALGAVASTVAYHDLRAVKEGFDIDRFAAVFD